MLYLPGSLFFRACRAPYLPALIAAPVFSITVYELLAISLAHGAIKASFTIVFLPTCLLALCVWLMVALFGKKKQKTAITPQGGVSSLRYALPPKQDLVCFGAYLLVGMAATFFIYIASLNNPASFVQSSDTVFHYNLARAFLESGTWSCLSPSFYAAGNQELFNPLPHTGYYPAAWHLIVAMLSSATAAPIALSAHVVNALFLALVFPSGIFLVLKTIFPDNFWLVLTGSLMCMACAAAPWVLFATYPLWPNAASVTLVPLFLAIFIRFLGIDTAIRERILLAGTLCLGILLFVFMQPNSIFTAAVLLIPFCAYQAGQLVSCHKKQGRVYTCKVVPALIFLACAALIWYMLYKAPFLQSTVQYVVTWQPPQPPIVAAIDILLLNLSWSRQYILAVFVAIGFVALLRKPQYRWLDMSYLLAAVILFIDFTSGEGFIKHFLAGFWYTDWPRVSAVVACGAIPLASVGLYELLFAIARMYRKLSESKKRRYALPAFVIGVLCCFFITGLAALRLTVFGSIKTTVALNNDNTISSSYDSGEVDFVEKVIEEVGSDVLVLNLAHDGSCYAYGINGLCTMNRYRNGYGGPDETRESYLLRYHLCEVSTNPEVQQVLESLDARYVIFLKRDPKVMCEAFPNYDPNDWAGYVAIDDTTPGFEPVLCDGDMRLYKIQRHPENDS